jgi:hypothetical protein
MSDISGTNEIFSQHCSENIKMPDPDDVYGVPEYVPNKPEPIESPFFSFDEVHPASHHQPQPEPQPEPTTSQSSNLGIVPFRRLVRSVAVGLNQPEPTIIRLTENTSNNILPIGSIVDLSDLPDDDDDGNA